MMIWVNISEFKVLSLYKRSKLAKLMGFREKQGFLTMGNLVHVDKKSYLSLKAKK